MIARSELSSSPFSRWQHSMNVLECASKIPRGRANRRARARPDRRRIPLRLRWSVRRSRPEEATADPKVRATRRPTNAATGIRTKMRVRVNPVGLVVGLRARSLGFALLRRGSLSVVVVGATRVHIRVQGAQTGFQVSGFQVSVWMDGEMKR